MDERFAYEDGMDLQAQLSDALASAYECINQMVPLKREIAELTRQYKVKRAERTVYERDVKKTPVSVIDAVVKGTPELADIEFKITLAEATFDANYEAILFHKKRADAVREQISREWANTRNQL